VRDSAIAEARKALAMDEKSPEGHLALAMVKYQNFELREAAKSFERVLQLNASHGDALHDYAHLLVETKHADEGIAMMRRAVEVEPLNPHFQYCVGQVFLFARQWDACIQATLKVVEMDSSFDRGYIEWQLGDANLYRGDTSKALEHFKTRRDRLQDWGAGFWYHYFSGNKRIAEQEWEKVKPLAVKTRWFSLVFKRYAWMKDKEQTLTWLERAYDERDPNLPWANTFPEFDFLIGDPRFEALMKKAGFRD
jgi:tetratricopeptide (TPR) repeat protein